MNSFKLEIVADSLKELVTGIQEGLTALLATPQLINNQSSFQNGAPDTARTCDLLIRNQTPSNTPEPTLDPAILSEGEVKQKRTRKAKEATASNVPVNTEGKVEVATAAPITEPKPEPPKTIAAEVQVATATATDTPITRDQIHKALKSVNDNFGIEVAVKCVNALNANRISDIQEADFPKFLKICAEAKPL